MISAVVIRPLRCLLSGTALLSLAGCAGSESGATGDDRSARATLKEPEATFPEAFSSVGGVRELSNGRVMVADRLGQALVIVDLAAGTADTIGRQGGGPGEYNSPSRLFSWLGDSTIMVDLGNTRFTPVGADGGFGTSQPLMRQDGETMSLIMPEGTDRHGNVYYQARAFAVNPGSLGADRPDSARIVRWNPDTGVVDTVASVGLPENRVERSGNNVSMMTIPFSPSDDWGVTWDGRVAVARAVGFRVEWHAYDGRRTVGPQVTDAPVTITQADRESWLEARANPPGGAMFITVEAGGGGRSMRAGAPPRGGTFVGPQVDDGDWPDVKPPFPPSGLSVTPDGQAWARRHTVADAPPEYDVFDHDGNRVRTVLLPDNTRVVGFGAGVVYVSRTDEYDLQWLEKYRR
jgi:hypothetical protein